MINMILVAFGDQGMHGFGTMQGAYWVGDGDFFFLSIRETVLRLPILYFSFTFPPIVFLFLILLCLFYFGLRVAVQLLTFIGL